MSDAVPRTLSAEELQPSRDEDEEPVATRQCTEPTKRCGKRNAKTGWHCKHRFPVSDPCKNCPKCRKSNKKYKSGDKGKAVNKKYSASDKGRAVAKKSKDAHKVEIAESNAKYRVEHKVERAEYNAEYYAEHKVERDEYSAEYDAEHKVEKAERNAERKADPEKHAHDLKVDAERKAERKADPEKHAHDLKVNAEYRVEHKVERAEYNAKYDAEHKVEKAERDRKRNATLQGRFQKMICKFGVNGLDGSFSTKMQKLGFVDTEDLRAFFRRQFQPGMTFDNHGRQRIDGPRMWHIGHMIVPQYAYDADLEEEQLRCFHKSNLAPQWADENWRQGTALPSDDVLLEYQHLWPMSWKNKLPSAQLRADIQGRRLDRASNAYDSDSGDDSDFDSDFDFYDSDDEAGPSGVQTMPQDSDSD